METIYAAAIIAGFVALGEIASKLTRARVPSLLVAMLGVFIAARAGLLPETLVEASGLAVLGAMILPAVMVHLGTVLSLSELRQQYKAILVALGSALLAVIVIVGVATFVFDYPTAVASSAPFVGGVVSTVLTVSGLTAHGHSALVAVPVMVMLLAMLPGMPIASMLLRRHAAALVASGHVRSSPARVHQPAMTAAGTGADIPTGEGQDGPRARGLRIPRVILDNDFVVLFILLGLGSAAQLADNLTGVSYAIWGLAFGVLAAWAGLLPKRALQQSNGFSLAMLAIIAVVIPPLLTTTWPQVLAVLAIVSVVIVAGGLGLIAGGYVMSRLVGWKPTLGIPVALTAVFGFPADYLIAHEVAENVGRDEDERRALQDIVLPPMLIGGFTTVSAGSIVVASILVGTL